LRVFGVLAAVPARAVRRTARSVPAAAMRRSAARVSGVRRSLSLQPGILSHAANRKTRRSGSWDPPPRAHGPAEQPSPRCSPARSSIRIASLGYRWSRAVQARRPARAAEAARARVT